MAKLASECYIVQYKTAHNLKKTRVRVRVFSNLKLDSCVPLLTLVQDPKLTLVLTSCILCKNREILRLFSKNLTQIILL